MPLYGCRIPLAGKECVRDCARRRVSKHTETGWADGVFTLHAGRKELFDTLTRRMARDGTYMIFGESVLGKLAMTFFMAMVPVVELRGAIPLGVAAGLPPAVAAVTAMAGNLTPVPCILLLLRRVFALMRKSAWLGPKVDRLERRAHLKGRKVRKYRTLGLVLLVAIPLPGTGAWTGALVADVLDIRMRTALPAIAAGVVIAGCITTAVTCGVAGLM